MKLLTAALLKKLPALRSQDGKGLDALAIVKFFNPTGSHTWYASEFDPIEKLFFGKVVSSDCPEGELGYFSLAEIESLRGRFGLPMERDRWFDPTPLKDCK